MSGDTNGSGRSGNGSSGSGNGKERAAWKPTPGKTNLESLLAFADTKDDDLESGGTPWEPGHELQITGRGGLLSKERRRVTVVQGAYANAVAGDLNISVSGNYEHTASKSKSVSIALSSGTDLPAAAWGLDKLTVDGNARLHFHERTTLMSGTVARTWHGNVTRFVGMEGVICGGAYVKTHVGPSASLSALVTGDVYGGCLRLSGARVLMAIMHYRAAMAAAWMTGAYVRCCSFVIVPVVGSPSAEKPPTRLQRAGKIFLATCPFLEMAYGVLMIPVAAFSFIAGVVNKVRKKPPKPPVMGPPRTWMRNGAAMSVTAGTDVTV